jgi:hypothetical protein
MFFLRKSKIVLDSFTCHSSILELFPIAPAMEYLPDWWKRMPNQYGQKLDNGMVLPVSTIKRCQGFIDLYKTGFIIPLWSELLIGTNNRGEWAYVNSDSDKLSIIQHEKEQFGNHFDDKLHIKILSPWLLKEKTGVRFYWTGCPWNDINNKIVAMPGIVEFKYQNSSNINMFLAKEDMQADIKAGTPIVHMIPLVDKEVEIRNHCVDTIEYDKMSAHTQTHISFLNNYNTRKKILDQKESKCPFGFKNKGVLL